jgi:15,16-dihydrobiliverdin:ferredoxin oxidoreductase
MEEESKIRFNQILREEMGKVFDLNPLPLGPELKSKHAGSEDAPISMKSERLQCAKTGGIRIGEMDLKGSMIIHFGNAPPANGYDFPVLGYTFVYANKCAIVVLDLAPVSRDEEYATKYMLPLKEISQKYQGIPTVEGGRSGNVHDFAKVYDSGYSLYNWCERQYLPDLESAFRDYVHVFCDCIRKAEPLTDREALSQRDEFMERYVHDYVVNDPGAAPLKSHFGSDWAERYLKDFLFAP